ncbi:MAG: glycosyltransferase family 4 protein [Thermoproteota archaeon]
MPLLVLDKLLTSKVDVFMTNSQYTAQFVKQIYRVTPQVVNPGVDLENFSGEVFVKESPIILSVCRIDPIKRVELLIKAMKLVLKDLHNIKLYIVGSTDYSPNYTQYLISLIKKLGLENNVFITGKVLKRSLVKFYEMCDIFCLFSKEETFGIAVLEAMSCGKPVIVSARGALPYLVKDGKTGFVVQSDREKDYAEKMKFLLTHPEIRAKMGEEGRKMVENSFTWKIFVDLIEKAIRSLVKEQLNILYQ